MELSRFLKMNIMGENDDADILKVAENFEKLDRAAKDWSNFGNTGTVLETGGDFQVATVFPVPDEEGAIFTITLKMPRAYAEGDTVTVDGIAYNLYQGTDPALSDAWKAGEVVTVNFDKTSRRCWASAGGGAPRPLPAQVSNMQASTPEGETPSIVFSWTNPQDENFAGMVLIVKEGSAPNSVTDGVQVYKGTGTTATYSDGVQWDHTYFGRGFAYNSQNKYQMDATGAIASATPSNIPNQVSNVELVGNKGSATLTWTNPTNLSYSVTKVIQKIDSDPENPNDGTQVYEGTGTTVTVDNLQDGVDYRFGIFAIGKNGKYKEAVVKDYIPEIYPKYSYTGNHTLVKDENNHWRIKFLSSGVLEWLSPDTSIDVFLVGGGSGADCQQISNGIGFGGAGGYTKTFKKVTISPGQRINVVIGAGGVSASSAAAAAGGTTSFGNYSAQGGQGPNGGSGAGANSLTHYIADSYPAGNGGEDGADGGNAKVAYGSSRNTVPGGKGQGSTTREFGEAGGELYSSAGGGSAYHSATKNGYSPIPGKGGSGNPLLATSGSRYVSSSGSRIESQGGSPGGGYGGGAGGGTGGNSNTGDKGTYPTVSESVTRGGRGAQGIVIIRDARESAQRRVNTCDTL